MSISAKRREVNVRFSDFSGGVNYSEDSSRINRNQVQDCKNAILRKNGAMRRPGCSGIAGFDIVAPVKGFCNYLNLTGTERLLLGSEGKLFEINASTGAKTERITLGGTGNFSFATSLGKAWIANGTKAVKVEADTAYQVGITAPVAGSAAAANSASGALPVGVYQVYIGYAREVSSDLVLYSTGYFLGAITIAAPNDAITISNFALSTDPQVGKRVVWMSDANGSTVYRYYTTANTGSTSVTVENATAKAVSIIYNVAAANNASVPAFKYIHAGDGRIWGSVSNRLHYSLRNTSNPYDLERFFPLNFIDFPHEITGIFSIGSNLYVNTPVGIYVQPDHDVTARSVWVEKRWRFYNMNTVVDHNGGKIGLTNDGIKFFDGEKFLDYDISDAVKSEVTKMYETTYGLEPFGLIIRRDIRTEYHICYNDYNLGTTTNNRRLVLNLDKLAYYPDKQVQAPFELWTNGATHMVNRQNNSVFHVQSHATAPKLYTENILKTVDNGIYLEDGTLGTSASTIEMIVITRTELLDMSARINWTTLRAMLRVAYPVRIDLFLRDVEGKISSNTFGSGQGNALWDVMTWDVDTWASSSPSLVKKKLPMNLHSYMMYIKLYQKADDPEMNILEVSLDGVALVSRFT